MYNFNQWLKLREVDEFGSYTPEEIVEMERKRKADEKARLQQQQQPTQQVQTGGGFSVSKALGVNPNEVEILPFPKQNKTGFRNKKQGSPGFGRVFYIDNGLAQDAKEKFFNDLRKEFGTGASTNNANSSSQEPTQKQLDDRFVKKALVDLDRLAQSSGDTGASSLLDKVRTDVLTGTLSANLQKAIIDAYKNSDLNIFRKAYEASRRIR